MTQTPELVAAMLAAHVSIHDNAKWIDENIDAINPDSATWATVGSMQHVAMLMKQAREHLESMAELKGRQS